MTIVGDVLDALAQTLSENEDITDLHQRRNEYFEVSGVVGCGKCNESSFHI